MMLEIHIHVLGQMIMMCSFSSSCCIMRRQFTGLDPGPVLQIEGADEVGGPAAHEAIEDLEQHPRRHAQLSEGIRQRQQHLCNL